jgi:hypothetical protein
MQRSMAALRLVTRPRLRPPNPKGGRYPAAVARSLSHRHRSPRYIGLRFARSEPLPRFLPLTNLGGRPNRTPPFKGNCCAIRQFLVQSLARPLLPEYRRPSGKLAYGAAFAPEPAQMVKFVVPFAFGVVIAAGSMVGELGWTNAASPPLGAVNGQAVQVARLLGAAGIPFGGSAANGASVVAA